MITLGLTGSIGMGKSETARMFRELGVPVFDADASVHKLQAKGGLAVPLIAQAFPGCVKGDELSRAALGALVFSNPDRLARLEAIMHPLVAADRKVFFEQARQSGAALVVLDVPLLFETGGDKTCDKVVVVSAPASVQRARVLARAGMTAEKFNDILARQTPDRLKRQNADFIIETDKGFDHAKTQVRAVVEKLKAN